MHAHATSRTSNERPQGLLGCATLNITGARPTAWKSLCTTKSYMF